MTSLLLSGSFARLRDIKWLFSHAGGTIPMMAGRINSFYGARPNLKAFAPEGIEGELRRLHYDNITKKAEWPDWTPPPEMIARQPYLPRFMAGGPGNPLGARAMYLGTTV